MGFAHKNIIHKKPNKKGGDPSFYSVSFFRGHTRHTRHTRHYCERPLNSVKRERSVVVESADNGSL